MATLQVIRNILSNHFVSRLVRTSIIESKNTRYSPLPNKHGTLDEFGNFGKFLLNSDPPAYLKVEINSSFN